MDKPKYHLLQEGEIIQLGDEYYSPMQDKWIKVSDGEPDEDGFYPDAIIGYEYNSEEFKPIRRKIS